MASTGVGLGSGMGKAAIGATSTQAAGVLLPAVKRGAVDEDLLAQAGMPWDVRVEEEKPGEAEAAPHKGILGKEIIENEWDSFMNPMGGLEKHEHGEG